LIFLDGKMFMFIIRQTFILNQCLAILIKLCFETAEKQKECVLWNGKRGRSTWRAKSASISGKKSRKSPQKQPSLQHEQQQQKQRHNSENLIDLSPKEKSEK
jgi:hypothetical protein